jgi:hypothetical protein
MMIWKHEKNWTDVLDIDKAIEQLKRKCALGTTRCWGYEKISFDVDFIEVMFCGSRNENVFHYENIEKLYEFLANDDINYR